ncbi:hypothetical protein HBB16_05560 [Pseudonocardia sp. MCCB 268]|nr:hypothetical protein [Pseudonocardia cytotoxica]
MSAGRLASAGRERGPVSAGGRGGAPPARRGVGGSAFAACCRSARSRPVVLVGRVVLPLDLTSNDLARIACRLLEHPLGTDQLGRDVLAWPDAGGPDLGRLHARRPGDGAR